MEPEPSRMILCSLHFENRPDLIEVEMEGIRRDKELKKNGFSNKAIAKAKESWGNPIKLPK